MSLANSGINFGKWFTSTTWLVSVTVANGPILTTKRTPQALGIAVSSESITGTIKPRIIIPQSPWPENKLQCTRIVSAVRGRLGMACTLQVTTMLEFYRAFRSPSEPADIDMEKKATAVAEGAAEAAPRAEMVADTCNPDPRAGTNPGTNLLMILATKPSITPQTSLDMIAGGHEPSLAFSFSES